jgi:mRNA-degrading endonuclease RelE of RelBE toxin-antitoxin system
MKDKIEIDPKFLDACRELDREVREALFEVIKMKDEPKKDWRNYCHNENCRAYIGKRKRCPECHAWQ